MYRESPQEIWEYRLPKLFHTYTYPTVTYELIRKMIIKVIGLNKRACPITNFTLQLIGLKLLFAVSIIANRMINWRLNNVKTTIFVSIIYSSHVIIKKKGFLFISKLVNVEMSGPNGVRLKKFAKNLLGSMWVTIMVAALGNEKKFLSNGQNGSV